jgi:hypothetical protein
MTTYAVAFSKGVSFGLLMYGGDCAPTQAAVRAALKRRGLSDEIISRVTWRISVVKYDFGGGGRIAARDR